MTIQRIKEMEAVNYPFGGALWLEDGFFDIYNTALRKDYYFNGWDGWYKWEDIYGKGDYKKIKVTYAEIIETTSHLKDFHV